MLKAYYIHASIQCRHTIVIYIGLTTINKCLRAYNVLFVHIRECDALYCTPFVDGHLVFTFTSDYAT